MAENEVKVSPTHIEGQLQGVVDILQLASDSMEPIIEELKGLPSGITVVGVDEAKEVFERLKMNRLSLLRAVATLNPKRAEAAEEAEKAMLRATLPAAIV